MHKGMWAGSKILGSLIIKEKIMQTKEDKRNQLKNKVEEYLNTQSAGNNVAEGISVVDLDMALSMHELVEQLKIANKLNAELSRKLGSVIEQNAVLSEKMTTMNLRVETLERNNKKLVEKVTKLSDCAYNGKINVK